MPYYHVIVSLKSRPQEDALALDLSEKKLMDRILKPKLEGRKFACDLGLVDPDDVKSIRITKTDKPILEVIGGSFVPTYTQYWEAANSGEDVTEDFIPKTEAEVETTSGKGLSKDIFIVHGRDYEPVEELKAILKELDLNPIVLHEQPSRGRTVVEKLEKYSDVGYAFVILTPDDSGLSTEEARKLFTTAIGKENPTSDDLQSFMKSDDPKAAYTLIQFFSLFKWRARQNVVMEFGYFMGLLGRERVCCLYKGDIELPSDMHGIVYIPFKESVNEVRDNIIKELKAAGYEI